MRITFVTGSICGDGPEAGLAGLAEHLCGQGHDIKVLCAVPRGRQLLVSGKARYIPYATSTRPATQAAALLHCLSRMPLPDVFLVSCDRVACAAAATIYHRLTSTLRHRPRFVFLLNTIRHGSSACAKTTAFQSLAHKLARKTLGSILRRADTIILAGEDMRRLLANRYGAHVCDGKARIIHPWCDAPPPATIDRATHPLANRIDVPGDAFMVMHHSAHADGHDNLALAQAIELTSTDPSIIWVLAGNNPRPDQLRRAQGDRALRNVRHLPTASPCDTAQLMHMADAHVVSQATHLTGTVSSRRLAQVMACAKPVIAVAPEDAECSRIIRAHKAGHVIPAGRGEMLARSVWQLRDSPTQRSALSMAARLAFEKTMCTKAAYPRLERILVGEE